MEIRELRLHSGLSQRKFAEMFNIPIATLKDWEQGRRKPPVYVIGMIQTILENKGMLISEEYLKGCEERRKSVERALAIVLSATNGPDETFLGVLDDYIDGKISLEEIERRVNGLEYIQ